MNYRLFRYTVGLSVLLLSAVNAQASGVWQSTAAGLPDEDKLSARWHKTFCMPDVYNTALQLYVEGSIIPAGTVIRQKAGPTAAKHSNTTLTEAIPGFYPFSDNYKVYENAPVDNGTYVFEITGPGGTAYELTTDYQRIEIRHFSYTTAEACDGLHVYPSGEIYDDGVLQHCYYKMIEAPAGVDTTNSRIEGGDTSKYFVLPKPGRYAFRISQWNSGDCAADTIVINHQPPALTFDSQIMYACHTGGTPNFIMTAKNGIAPYTYELYENGLPVATNTTGSFTYGNYANTYTAKVIDVCGRDYTADLQMTDLGINNVIGGPGRVCLGDTIALTCRGLGAPGFWWAGPNNFTSAQQNPTVVNATVAATGTYTVTFQPMGCDAPVSQSLEVTVYATPPPVYTDTIQLCLNGLAVIPDAVSLAGHVVYWLKSDGVTECPKPGIATSSVHTEKYYLVQRENLLGCLSVPQEVVINVNALPSPAIAATSSAVCPATAPVIILSGPMTEPAIATKCMPTPRPPGGFLRLPARAAMCPAPCR